jgi:hypothetical protein
MPGQKNLTGGICPMTLAAKQPNPCIGGACMAWRDIVPPSGYCGLAGQPILYQAPADGTQAAYLAKLSGAADSGK